MGRNGERADERAPGTVVRGNYDRPPGLGGLPRAGSGERGAQRRRRPSANQAAGDQAASKHPEKGDLRVRDQIGIVLAYAVLGVGLVAAWQLRSALAVEVVCLSAVGLTAVIFGDFSSLSVRGPGVDFSARRRTDTTGRRPPRTPEHPDAPDEVTRRAA